MKERPILFSAPMVRALLAGTKTQTRRVVKLPVKDKDVGCELAGSELAGSPRDTHRHCPYGAPGDVLWVREAHRVIAHESVTPLLLVKYCADEVARHCHVTPREYELFRARKSELGSVVLARFSYRSISRLLLEITAVRVERLNDITEVDAIAEGVTKGPLTNRWAYRELWEDINGAGSWALNPWVWVIEFRKVEGYIRR